MTSAEKKLRKQVKELEERVKALEARPYITIPVQPMTIPEWMPPWRPPCTGDPIYPAVIGGTVIPLTVGVQTNSVQ